MEVTQVRIFPVEEEKLKAFVSIIIDDCFVVSDIKIIQGNNGLFISMPSKKRKNGTFRDIAHPLNSDTRRTIEERVISIIESNLAAEEQLEDEADKLLQAQLRTAGPAAAGIDQYKARMLIKKELAKKKGFVL